MEELKNYLQSVLFGRFVEDINYYVAEYNNRTEDNGGTLHTRSTYTESFDSFVIRYDRIVEIRPADDTTLSMGISFSKAVILTSGGIFLGEFDSFTRYYQK